MVETERVWGTMRQWPSQRRPPVWSIRYARGPACPNQCKVTHFVESLTLQSHSACKVTPGVRPGACPVAVAEAPARLEHEVRPRSRLTPPNMRQPYRGTSLIRNSPIWVPRSYETALQGCLDHKKQSALQGYFAHHKQHTTMRQWPSQRRPPVWSIRYARGPA